MLDNRRKMSKDREKTGDRNRSWAEAIKHNGLFYGRKVAIAKVCKKEIRPASGNDELKPLKWRVVANKGRKCTVLEEHPLDCDAEAAFGKYGLPMDFIEACGYCEDRDAIKPLKVY